MTHGAGYIRYAFYQIKTDLRIMVSVCVYESVKRLSFTHCDI